MLAFAPERARVGVVCDIPTSCHSFHVSVFATLVLVPSVFAVLYERSVPSVMVRSVVTTVTVSTCSDDSTTSISGTGKAATRGWLPGDLTHAGIVAPT